ncbi:MAG: hypothetical protein PHX27_01795 [Candidatus ainarchaeum sp.]|nr:hypothetical protein [Candidatus ainarchaeum sp.]
MKISFIGCADNSINIFKAVAGALSKKISGLELNERFVPFVEDLPIVALEETEESDFIFVFVMVEENQKNFLIEKLVDVEIKSGVRILKAVEIDEISDIDEEEFIELKDSLVEKYSQLMVNILFNEIAFESNDKDFGL